MCAMNAPSQSVMGVQSPFNEAVTSKFSHVIFPKTTRQYGYFPKQTQGQYDKSPPQKTTGKLWLLAEKMQDNTIIFPPKLPPNIIRRSPKTRRANIISHYPPPNHS